MTPQMQQFVYLNGAIVLILVLYMVFGRTKRDPSRLRLGEGSAKMQDIEPQALRGSGSQQKPRPSEDVTQSQPKVRQLTVYFQFNGHDFESYEVLGLPAGSSFEVVEKTYREILAKEPDDAHEFYSKAFEAIRSQK